MTTRETTQLIENIFNALKNDTGENFESRFKKAYGKAAGRMNLKPGYQSAKVFEQVKAAVEQRLEQHTEDIAHESRLPNYFKFRRPVPLLNSEESTLLASLC